MLTKQLLPTDNSSKHTHSEVAHLLISISQDHFLCFHLLKYMVKSINGASWVVTFG